MNFVRPFAAALAAALSLPGLAWPALAQNPPAVASNRPVQVVGAQLRSLDKLVARVTQIDAPLNQEVKVGTLSITVRACVVSPPEAPPESSAFLEITETKPGEQSRPIFSGWMFASSPALSALENPVYDVWVVACKTTAAAPPATPPAPPPAAPPKSR